MPAIFISHSSKDNAAAAELQERLQQQGYRSVFLDFHPDSGIPAGRDWERELYLQLRACQAVVLLCSEHSMSSKWCFAEMTQASAMGKPIFPVRIAMCKLESMIASRQAIDVAADGPAAYERLWAGLKSQGVDPGASFDWNRERPPYPGLMAFEEEDAAVFFGRDADIQETLERLNRMRRFGGPRLLVVLGTSGCGKSSLVRAGVLPRLKRDPRQWLVLDVLRPRTAPLRELAIVLASAFAAMGQPRSWQALDAALQTPTPGDTAALAGIALELQIATGRRDACVVLTLDQMEELFGSQPPEDSQRFLQLLSAVIERADVPLIVVATLRSDFLGDLQQHPAMRGLAFDDVRIGPMTADGLEEVINGPARVAAFSIEPGLTRALIVDTGTDDALPLLAYTLRELYERFGEDRRLELREYRERLGGLTAAIAIAAEAVLAAEAPVDERLLRNAFARMVRISEDGHYARRPVAWSALPESVHGILERFVKARLLISSGDGAEPMLEVAHEALFRSWERLRSWLEEDKEQLLWQQRMRTAAEEWERSGRDYGSLLRGGRLAEANRWLDQAGDLPDDIRAYIAASNAQKRAETARAERGRRRTVGALAGGLGAALLFAVFAVTQWLRAAEDRRIADAQSRVAVARQLAAQAQLLAEDVQSEPVQRALLVAESLRRLPTLQAFVAWTQLQSEMPRLEEQFAHEGETSSVAWSPDGERVAVGDVRGVANVWHVATGERLLSLQHEGPVGDVAYSPDGSLLATAEDGGVAYLWDAETGVQRARLEQIEGFGQVLFSPDGSLVATVAYTRERGPAAWRVFHLWNTQSGELHASLPHPGDSGSQYMAFSADGRRMATTGPDKTVRVWDVAAGTQIAELPEPSGAYSLDFSPDGRRLATGAKWEGEVRIWDLETRSVTFLQRLADASFVYVVKFSPDGHRLASGGSARASTIWDADSGEKLFDIETVNNVRGFDFSEDGTRLASVSAGVYVSAANARLWDATTGRELARLGPEVLSTAIAFSRDGTRVVTAGGDASARVWSIGGVSSELRLEHGSELVAAAFTRDGARVVSFSDRIAKVWDLQTSTSLELLYSNANAGGLIQAADVSRDGRQALTGHYDGSVVIWDLATGERRALVHHDRSISGVTFSPDGRTVASASEDQTARIWSIDDGRELVRVVHDDTVSGVAFSPDGHRLATSSLDGSVRVWGVETGQQELRLEHSYAIWDVSYSPDGHRLAALAPENAEVQLWDATSGRRGATLTHEDLINAAEFSPDGRWIATASRDYSVALWNVETGERYRRFMHNGPAIGAAFSPDSSWLITWGAWEGPARVWEVATGAEIARLAHGADTSVQHAEFSSDGARIVTAGKDGTVRVWKWLAEDLLADLCSRVTRNLTEDEWQRFIGNEPYRATCPGIETSK